MYQRILVGTDGSDTASRAVAHALRLAASSGGTVHVATAWQPVPAMALAATGGAAVAADDGGWVRDVHAEAAHQAAGLGVQVQTHSVQGPAAAALLDLAEELGADLVVVGNAGMQGLRGRLGSVPNTVAHKARCAVLVVPTS